MEAKVPSFVCGANIYCNGNCKTGKHAPQMKKNPLDPTLLDPRPSLWQSGSYQQQCCLPPFEKPLPPPCYQMKLPQLENCYKGQQSDACIRRRTNFYKRWQLYLDRLPPIPGYDYKTYCCDDYVDLSKNNDFVRYSYFKPNVKGPRAKARANFLFPRLLGDSLAEQEAERSKCSLITECPEVCHPGINTPHDLRTDMEKRVRLYQEEPYTIWHSLQLAPVPNVGFVYGSTPIKSRIHPFTKDTSFTTPLDQFSTGNDSPFKEFRDLKMV